MGIYMMEGSSHPEQNTPGHEIPTGIPQTPIEQPEPAGLGSGGTEITAPLLHEQDPAPEPSPLYIPGRLVRERKANIPDISMGGPGMTLGGVPLTFNMTSPSAVERLYALPGGLARMERYITIVENGRVHRTEARIVIDAAGNVLDFPEDEAPPLPFSFYRPVSEMDAVSDEEQHAAGIALDGIRQAVFERYPNNTVRMLGVASNTIRKKDAFIQASADQDPNHLIAQHMKADSATSSISTDHIKFIERRPADVFSSNITYCLVDGGVRRWDQLQPSANHRLKADYIELSQEHTAREQGPEAHREFRAARAARQAVDNDPKLTAQMGVNYLPVGLSEVRALGRYTAEKLGLTDELRHIIGE